MEIYAVNTFQVFCVIDENNGQKQEINIFSQRNTIENAECMSEKCDGHSNTE